MLQSILVNIINKILMLDVLITGSTNTTTNTTTIQDWIDAQKSYQSFSNFFPTITQSISLSGSFHMENAEKFQEGVQTDRKDHKHDR